jgi:GT2 family glycosyltransferase
MTQHTIAVLMTCHNRRDTTLACLESLYCARASNQLDVFLVDDASTDGTGAAVRDRYPTVNIISGSGDLYWVGAMRLAYEHATTKQHDFTLWLNDDVVLAPTALTTLIATWAQLSRNGHERSIVVGAVVDPTTRTTSYSGATRVVRSRPSRFLHDRAGVRTAGVRDLQRQRRPGARSGTAGGRELG